MGPCFGHVMSLDQKRSLGTLCWPCHAEGGHLGLRIGHVTFFRPKEVILGLVLVTSHFFYQDRLFWAMCLSLSVFWNKSFPVSNEKVSFL